MLSNRNLLSMAEKRSYFEKFTALSSVNLSPQEAESFIELVWDQSRLKNMAKKVNMTTNTRNIRDIGFGSGRILFPADYFDQSKYKTAWAHNRQQLSTVELRACAVIYDSDLEDINVGTAAEFKAKLMSIVAKQIGNELEEIYWIGDTHSLSGFAADDARSTLDGWRYQLDHSQSGETYYNDVTGAAVILDASNTVTAKAADYTVVTGQWIYEVDASAPYRPEFKYGLMQKWLPSQYQGMGLDAFRFINSDKVTADYLAALVERGTPLGDAAIAGKAQLQWGLSPIVSMPKMPVTMKIDTSDTQKEDYQPASGNLTDCLYTIPENLVIGMQLDIQFEAERSAADRGTYFFYTIRTDCKIANVNACVFLKRLKVT